MAKPKQQPDEIEILKLKKGRASFCILGESPLIYNAMSLKVRQGLLAPKKKTAIEKASTVKHDPLAEYRASVYRHDEGPTLLCFPAVAFKRALASAALDLGGAKRAQIERLVWAIGDRVPIYGVPQLRMDVVRSADMNRTPDIRTRAILPKWCAVLDLVWMEPAVNVQIVGDLLAGAGDIRGIGDFRQEKGAGNYGQFKLVGADDKDFKAIVKAGSRQQQVSALDKPECYDDESDELLEWWKTEIKRRGHHAAGMDNDDARAQ